PRPGRAWNIADLPHCARRTPSSPQVGYQINAVPVRNHAREPDSDLDEFFDGESIKPRIGDQGT
ncbi:MAG TPA: hypothetical protein VK601_28375, partial [Kofleriaceae bacterium]|nr:hypothetical protein [Kofleriaceae bacterium]